MKRSIIFNILMLVSIRAFAIEITNLGLIPIDPINNYWIDQDKVLYIPFFKQNELRVFDLGSWENKEFLHEDGIRTWRLDMVFTPVIHNKEKFINISFTRENSRGYKGAVIGSTTGSFLPVPNNKLSFSKKMSAYSISIQEDGVSVSSFDVVPEIITRYTIALSKFPGVESHKPRFNPLKFQDYNPETGQVTISYKQKSVADAYTHYRARIVNDELEDITPMFIDGSGKPMYQYSNQMWILNNGLYLAGKYKYNLNTKSDSIPYATLIIVDADGKEIYEYTDFEMRMFDENFFRLNPDRTKILLWGSNLKDDKPGEATYLLEIKYK